MFEKDNKRDYAQVVARIQNINVNAPDGKMYSKDITKRELVIAYLNNGQSMTQQGMSMQDALDELLKQLVNRELIIAQFVKMENTGEMVINVADENKAWEAVYQYLDSQIYSQEQAIFQARNESFPSRETGSYSPKYPLPNLISFAERQLDYIDAERKYNETTEADRWAPQANSIPTSETGKEAVKRVLLSLAAQVESVKLSKEDADELKKDKAILTDYTKKNEWYDKIMGKKTGAKWNDWDGFFFIKKLLYNGQMDQVRYEKMQKFYNDRVGTILDLNDNDKATEKIVEIEGYYSDALKAQLSKYSGPAANKDYNAYFEDLKNSGGRTPFVFYHPTDEFFYVKHILLSFSDAQKADITNTIAEKGWANDSFQAQQYREKVAGEIKSFRHFNGEDVVNGEMGINEIYADIVKNVAGREPRVAEKAFDEMIYKYNTDPGIFNNEKGYLIPKKGMASGYVPQFDDGAYKLYDEGRGRPGTLGGCYDAVTEYGVHIMFYSQRLGWEVNTDNKFTGGIVPLRAFTSPLELATYQQSVFETILNIRQNDNFNRVQSDIVGPYIKKDAGNVVKWEKRYKDLWNRR